MWVKGGASMDNMNDTRHMLKNAHPSFFRKVLPAGWLPQCRACCVFKITSSLRYDFQLSLRAKSEQDIHVYIHTLRWSRRESYRRCSTMCVRPQCMLNNHQNSVFCVITVHDEANHMVAMYAQQHLVSATCAELLEPGSRKETHPMHKSLSTKVAEKLNFDHS
jgi:hypothetical protein